MLSWKPFQASDEDYVITYKWQILLSFLQTFSISIPAHGQHYKEKLFSGSAASCNITWPLTSHRGFNKSWPRETRDLSDVHMAADWSVDSVSRGSVQSGQEDLKSGWLDSLISGAHSCLRGDVEDVCSDSEAPRYEGNRDFCTWLEVSVLSGNREDVNMIFRHGGGRVARAT